MITQPFQQDSFFLLGWGGGGKYLRAGIRCSRGVLKGGYGKQTWAIKTIAERDEQTKKQKTGRMLYIEGHQRVGLRSVFIKRFVHRGRCS